MGGATCASSLLVYLVNGGRLVSAPLAVHFYFFNNSEDTFVLSFLSSWPEKLFFGRFWTYFDREMLNVVRRCNDGFRRFYDLGRMMF